MAKIRASKLRAAGLVGEYARADCELGHRLYEVAKSGVGACVHGESGRGKTYAASCAVRMWVDSGWKARLVSAPRLMEEIYAGFERDGDKHALDRACRIPLLALDDFGMERPTETAIESGPGSLPSSPATCESGCSRTHGARSPASAWHRGS